MKSSNIKSEHKESESFKNISESKISKQNKKKKRVK